LLVEGRARVVTPDRRAAVEIAMPFGQLDPESPAGLAVGRGVAADPCVQAASWVRASHLDIATTLARAKGKTKGCRSIAHGAPPRSAADSQPSSGCSWGERARRSSASSPW